MTTSRTPASITRRDALRWFGLMGTAAALAPLTARSADASSASSKTALPSLAGAQPGYYRFKIGALEALALTDGGAAFPLKMVWPKIEEEKIAAELKAAALAVDAARIPFNVLLVKIGAELVLIDAGCGAAFGPVGGRLVGNLAAAGIKPEQITAVFLSHAHGDHHGGLLDAESKAPVFKNARHFIARREFDFWMGTPDLSRLLVAEDDKKQFMQGAQQVLGGLKSRWNFIQPGDKLVDGLEIVDAPGHTPGHLAFLFSSGNEQLLHFVDAAHHHEITFAHPDWTFFGDTQPDLAVQTRKRLLDRAAADRLRLFGAHMPFPALGRVRSERGRYEYRIEPWVV